MYLTRGLWLPQPLKLELTQSNGHVTALWNAEALSQGATGTLTVRDGTETTVMPLNASKLAEGVIGFDRKSRTVTAELKVADQTSSATLR